jgi:protein-S-isoprenylcysteine O-methyltransferase Ste14
VDSLRIILFLGLVFHKLIWEILKRGESPKSARQTSPRKPAVWLVKAVKVMTLLFLVVQTLFLDIFPLSSQPSLLRLLGTTIYFVGLAIAVVGRLHLGRNWANLEDYQVLSEQALVTSGIYKYIRHPIYTGDMLLLLGLELALNSWLVLGVVLVVAVVVKQALAEETLLSAMFPNYEDYRRRTKMFIPGVV